MVRSIVFISAVLAAFIASVTAAPAPGCGSYCGADDLDSLVDIDAGRYIGTGDINAEGAAQGLVTAPNLDAYDLVNVVDTDDIMFSGGGIAGGMGGGPAPRPIYRPEPGHVCSDACHHGGLLAGLLKRGEGVPAAKKMMN